MALKFRTVKRRVMNGAEKDTIKTYAVAKSSAYCDMGKLCELISNRCAMSSADVKAILDSLNWAMSLELRSGSIVQVGEFGNFRMSVHSRGAAADETFDATRIKRSRIVFTPGAYLRANNELMEYEPDEVKVVEVKVECDKPHTV